MTDLPQLIADRLAAAFADVAGEPADPAVRRSRPGRLPGQRRPRPGQAARPQPPRGRPGRVLDAADLADLVAKVEIAGPGFLNLTLTDDALAAPARHRGGRRAARRPDVPSAGDASSSTTRRPTWPRRCTSATCARRSSATRSSGVLEHLGPRGDPAEPHRRLGHAVRHADRAPHRRGRGRGRAPSCRSATSTASTGGAREVRRRRGVQGAGPPAGRPAAAGRPRDAARCGELLVDRVGRATSPTSTTGSACCSRPTTTCGESCYNDELAGVVEELASRASRLDDGAECVFPPGFTGRDGEPQPLIVRKPRRRLRLRRHRPGRASATASRDLDAHAARSTSSARRSAAPGDGLRRSARQAGWLDGVTTTRRARRASATCSAPTARCSRPGRATRSGWSTCSTRRRAGAAAIVESNPDLSATSAGAVAQAVGIGAIKYADLSSDRVKDYVLDFDRMLAFEGNTGALHAVRPRPDPVDLPPRRGRPGHAARRRGPDRRAGRSARWRCALLGFEAVVRQTADGAASPTALCGYLFDLAQTFTAFYEACPVLKAPTRRPR